MGNRGSSSHAGGSRGGSRNFAAAKAFLKRAYGANHATAIMEIIQKAPREIQEMWAEYGSQFHASKLRNGEDGAYYSSRTDSVHLNIDSVSTGDGIDTPYEVVFHEYGHMTDYLISRQMGYGRRSSYSQIYNNGELGKTAKREIEAHLTRIARLHPELGDDREGIARALIQEARSKYSLRDRANISDMMEGAGIGVAFPLGAGHGLNYWPLRDNGLEVFAEITSAKAANPGSLIAIKDYFPKTYKVYETMLKERKRK